MARLENNNSNEQQTKASFKIQARVGLSLCFCHMFCVSLLIFGLTHPEKYKIRYKYNQRAKAKSSCCVQLPCIPVCLKLCFGTFLQNHRTPSKLMIKGPKIKGKINHWKYNVNEKNESMISRRNKWQFYCANCKIINFF